MGWFLYDNSLRHERVKFPGVEILWKRTVSAEVRTIRFHKTFPQKLRKFWYFAQCYHLCTISNNNVI